MEKKFTFFLFSYIFLIIFSSSVFFVKAQNAASEEYNIDVYNAQKILDKSVDGNYKPLDGYDKLTKENADEQFYAVIGRGIELALSLVGIVLVILIIYAGYLWFAADGNEEQIGKAKSYIINAVIGIAIVLLAYAITYFIMGRISGTIGNL